MQEGSTKKIVQTRLDYILTSLTNIQMLECVAILDNFRIGLLDHRPVFASLPTTTGTPHIASLNRELAAPINNTLTQQTLPPQPMVMYPKLVDNTEQWKSYQIMVQENFRDSSILMSEQTDTPELIESWTKELSEVITKAISATVGWDTTTKPPTPTAQTEARDSTQMSSKDAATNENPKTSQPYAVPPKHQVHKQALLKYKPKLQHEAYRLANVNRSWINKATSMITACLKHNDKFKDVPLLQHHLSHILPKVESSYQDLCSHLNSFAIQNIDDKPTTKSTDETEQEYRNKEVARILSLYIKNSKKPPTTT
jgi:hypothetical protein